MKNKVATVFTLLFVFGSLFLAFLMTCSSFSAGSYVEYSHLELGRILDANSTVVIGKVIKSSTVSAPEYSGGGNRRQKFRATIDVLMTLKGNTDQRNLTFDYLVLNNSSGGFVPLIVGQVILYTPNDQAPFLGSNVTWYRPYIPLSVDSISTPNLWYQDIESEIGAKVLRFLGYEVYDKQMAMHFFEGFYQDSISEDIDVKVSTRFDRWIIQGKCNRLLGWRCEQRDFCFWIASTSGEIYKCAEE